MRNLGLYLFLVIAAVSLVMAANAAIEAVALRVGGGL